MDDGATTRVTAGPTSAAVRLGLAALGGLAVGVATSYLQGVLAGSANVLANSGAVWTVVAVALAALVAASQGVTVGAGLLALAGEVAGYYAVASPLRGIATSTSERALWTVAALLIGPLAGYAGWCCRRGSRAQRVVACAALCGVVAGEGGYGVLRISHREVTRWLEVIVGVVGALVVVVVLARRPRERVLGVAAVLVIGGLTFLAYGETVLR